MKRYLNSLVLFKRFLFRMIDYWNSQFTWTVVCILSTVKKAARLAVNVASMRTTNNQYAATRTLPDIDLGASPPPTKQGNWITVFLSIKWRHKYYILLIIPWGVNEVRANQKLSFSVNSLKNKSSKWDSLYCFILDIYT